MKQTSKEVLLSLLIRHQRHQQGDGQGGGVAEAAEGAEDAALRQAEVLGSRALGQRGQQGKHVLVAALLPG